MTQGLILQHRGAALGVMLQVASWAGGYPCPGVQLGPGRPLGELPFPSTPQGLVPLPIHHSHPVPTPLQMSGSVSCPSWQH